MVTMAVGYQRLNCFMLHALPDVDQNAGAVRQLAIFYPVVSAQSVPKRQLPSSAIDWRMWSSRIRSVTLGTADLKPPYRKVPMNAPSPSSESSTPPAYTGDAQNVALEARRQYRAILAGAGSGGLITVLHIGALHTAVIAGRDAEPAATLVLVIGAQKTAGDFFRHSPPTPLELENAIAAVEDEVTRAVTVLPGASTLYCSGAAVREIATLAGVAPGETGARVNLVLDAMEQTFNRLAAVAEGRPAIQEGLPDSPEFAAALLILREFMHHLRFASVIVVV